MMLASLFRPDSWNLPLFVHVFGAMVLVGALLVAASSLLLARGDARLLRLGYLTLLTVGLPGYLVMRVGAEWIYSREHLDELPTDPTWIGIGYVTADLGALLLLISLIMGGFGLRKLRNGKTGLIKASLVLSVVLLVTYLVTIWAMGAKP
jgi:cytochrome bd-type quinol oxidase subunit 1